MLELLVVIVAGYVVFRIALAIWRASNAITIASSWGLVLAGQAEKEEEVIQRIHAAVEAARVGPVWWKRHADRLLGIFLQETQTYSAVGFRGVQALSGVHPAGTDLYVSWNLVSRGRASTRLGEEFGLNPTNDMRAFASTTLGITQRAVIEFAFPQGEGPPPDQLKASGILGPLVPPSHDQARDAVAEGSGDSAALTPED